MEDFVARVNQKKQMTETDAQILCKSLKETYCVLGLMVDRVSEAKEQLEAAIRVLEGL